MTVKPIKYENQHAFHLSMNQMKCGHGRNAESCYASTLRQRIYDRNVSL